MTLALNNLILITTNIFILINISRVILAKNRTTCASYYIINVSHPKSKYALQPQHPEQLYILKKHI
jgi:hypothetical protein